MSHTDSHLECIPKRRPSIKSTMFPPSANVMLRHQQPLEGSAQLHNGTLRSCRKIRGKAPVQKSPAVEHAEGLGQRHAMWPFLEKKKCQCRTPQNPTPAAHYPVATAPRPDNTTLVLIFTSADPIRPVHCQYRSPGREGDPPNQNLILAIFTGF